MTTPAVDEGGRPDFAGFVAALREEAGWVERIHSPDTTGQARSDAGSLRQLAAYVAAVGRRLGYMGPERQPAFRCSTPASWPEDLVVVRSGTHAVAAKLDVEDEEEARRR